MRCKELLHTCLRLQTPAVFPPNPSHDLSRGDLIKQSRKCNREFPAFIGDPRPNAEQHSCNDYQQDPVNLRDGKRTGATRQLRPSLNERYEWMQKVCKQNCEEENNEDAPGSVDEPCYGREQHDGGEYRCCTP